MQAVLEDEAEEEEEEEDDGAFEIDEDIGGARFAQDEGLTEDGEPIPPEGEEEEEEEEEQEEEEEEEVDLDDAVEEASEFDYDDDDEDDEDQAGEEEDPFMVDEEYDEFTTITRTATTTSNATRPPPPGLQVPEPRTLHLQPQQHRRHPRTSEISEQHFSDIYESDSHRSAAAIAEDLEPASSSIGVLGRYRRASPEASITEHSNNNYYDSRRPVEDENDGESEMEVD